MRTLTIKAVTAVVALSCALSAPTIVSAPAASAAAGRQAPAPASAAPSAPTTSAALWSQDWSTHLWHLEALGLLPLHAAGFRGEGAVIAILDAGFDLSHSDLTGKVDEAFEVRRSRIRPLSQSGDPGHGTHVAAIAAGSARDHTAGTGVAPEARLIVGNVLTGVGDDAGNIAAGLRYVAGKADVVNLSLGMERKWSSPEEVELVCSAVQAAHAAGTLVVVAAGNERLLGNPALVPASCLQSITVSAVDSSLAPAPFTSFDRGTSLAAPGVQITAAAAQGSLPVPWGDLDHRAVVSYSGTSMASPIVAGVAALVAAAHPEESSDQLRARLLSSAQDLGTRGWDAFYGSGLVAPAAALGVPGLDPSPAPVPALGMNFAMPGPGSTGVFTRAGRVRWSFEPPASGPAVAGYQATFFAVASGAALPPVTADLPPSAVRASLAAASEYGWLILTTRFEDGTQRVAGPFVVFPHDEFDPVMKKVKARWDEKARLRAEVTLRRPLRPGESIYTMIWYGHSHRVPAPMLAHEVLTVPSGAVSTTATLSLDVKDPDLERAWRSWYAGGHRLSVVVCLAPFNGILDCARQDVGPTLAFSAYVAPLGDGTASVRVEVNPASGAICRMRGDKRPCAGERISVRAWGVTRAATLDASGAASIVIPMRTHSRTARVEVSSERGSHRAFAPVLKHG